MKIQSRTSSCLCERVSVARLQSVTTAAHCGSVGTVLLTLGPRLRLVGCCPGRDPRPAITTNRTPPRFSQAQVHHHFQQQNESASTVSRKLNKSLTLLPSLSLVTLEHDFAVLSKCSASNSYAMGRSAVVLRRPCDLGSRSHISLRLLATVWATSK